MVADVATIAAKLSSRHTNFEGLDFDDNLFCEALSRAISRGPLNHVQTLWLQNTNIGDRSVVALADAGKKGSLPNLYEMYLNRTGITDHGFACFLGALGSQKMANFTGLDVSDTDVGDDGLLAVAELAKNEQLRQLESLRMIGTKVDVTGISELAKQASLMPRFHVLDVRSTPFSQVAPRVSKTIGSEDVFAMALALNRSSN